ncbi:MAG TPA: hypothetical protein VK034_02475, partial [Enhygromyxa sp.]|nr:hypothetical protein [Enhygromyxa sp.]
PQAASMVLYEVDSAARILAGLARNEVVELRELDVGLRVRADWPAALAAPAFERLGKLRLSVNGEEVGRLFEGARLPELVTLELGDDFPVERLSCAGLRRLSLGGPLDSRSLAGLLERHPRLQTLRIWEMTVDEVNRALAIALTLPSEHPLRVLALPTTNADQELLGRARERFGGDFYADEE